MVCFFHLQHWEVFEKYKCCLFSSNVYNLLSRLGSFSQLVLSLLDFYISVSPSRGWCCSTILAAFNIKYVLSRRHRVPTFGLFYAAWPLSCGFLASQRCPIFLQIFRYDELECNWASIPAHLVPRMHSMGAVGHGQGRVSISVRLGQSDWWTPVWTK